MNNVIIIGGGIAGLCAAISLQKIGIEVKVYDKNNEPTVAGAGIIIAPNAMQALEPYGISERIKNSATKVTALNLYPKKELFSIN
ncbi:FAD-dependent oxidoreductase [Bacillus pacificus]